MITQRKTNTPPIEYDFFYFIFKLFYCEGDIVASVRWILFLC